MVIKPTLCTTKPVYYVLSVLTYLRSMSFIGGTGFPSTTKVTINYK